MCKWHEFRPTALVHLPEAQCNKVALGFTATGEIKRENSDTSVEVNIDEIISVQAASTIAMQVNETGNACGMPNSLQNQVSCLFPQVHAVQTNPNRNIMRTCQLFPSPVGELQKVQNDKRQAQAVAGKFTGTRALWVYGKREGILN